MGTYIGLINDSDTLRTQIWGGHNSHGFAIMNSASFNVNEGQNLQGVHMDREGVVMKEALEQCKTLKDFEEYLDRSPKPLGVAAHFGVIDAEGGAAFYEVNNYTWTKYDANEDPRGYVIRTNYSMTGKENKGYGYVRYACATALFDTLDKGKVTLQDIGSKLSRSMYHGLLQVDYRALAEADALPSRTGFIDSDDLIARYDTSSMILIEGVTPQSSPELTTTWVQIGNPYLTPLVPVWTWQEVPADLQLPTPQHPETLASIAKKLKLKLYPLRTIEERRYLYMPLIYRPDGKGLSQLLENLEEQIIPKVEATQSHDELQKLQSQIITTSLGYMHAALTE